MLCVYCAIGQRASAVAKVVANLREKGAMDYTVVVVAEGNEAPGLVYITPYAATSIAEYFMEKGRDVLIVYDDLTHHARAYRELSLLLRRPPGREAFPGDIFYIHSRMLERATHLSKETRRRFPYRACPSLKPLRRISPLTSQPISSPSQTVRFISRPRCSNSAFFLPSTSASPSREWAERHSGRLIAQLPAISNSPIRNSRNWKRSPSSAPVSTKPLAKSIDHGQRIRACFKQPESQPVSMEEQICVLLALTAKLFDPVPLEKVNDAEQALQKAAAQIPAEIAGRLTSADKLSDADRKAILDIATRALAPLPPLLIPKPRRTTTKAQAAKVA